MGTIKQRTRSPKIVMQPHVRQGIQNGVNQLANAIAPTLGPLPRMVVNENIVRNALPEQLDDGAMIARRIVELADGTEDLGAMYLRHMLWTIRDSVGDGTATATVLFQSIFNNGVRYLTAGGNAMLLRRYLERIAEEILTTLDCMTLKVDNTKQVEGLALSICHDAEIAQTLSKVFDAIGEFGRLEIRAGRGRDIWCEFAEGSYWDSGLLGCSITNRPNKKLAIADVPVLITDFEIDDARQLLPLFNKAHQDGIKQLVIFVSRVSEIPLAVLSAPKNKERVEIIFIKIPSITGVQSQVVLRDLAMITGGKALLEKAGWKLEDVHLDDLGWVRRLWADKTYFGIIGGQGNARQLRQHIADLKQAYYATDDLDTHHKLYERLNKLISGTAIIWVGSHSTLDVEMRRDLAQKTANAIRRALHDGVIAGGGTALLNCIPQLESNVVQTDDSEERAAYNILKTALETPFRVLLQNAGYKPDAIIAQLHQCPDGFGFDVMCGEVVHVGQAGLVDPVTVIKTILRTTIKSVALALTIDTIVHRANPPEEMKP